MFVLWYWFTHLLLSFALHVEKAEEMRRNIGHCTWTCLVLDAQFFLTLLVIILDSHMNCQKKLCAFYCNSMMSILWIIFDHMICFINWLYEIWLLFSRFVAIRHLSWKNNLSNSYDLRRWFVILLYKDGVILFAHEAIHWVSNNSVDNCCNYYYTFGLYWTAVIAMSNLVQNNNNKLM